MCLPSRNAALDHSPLRFLSHPMRESAPTMDFYQRIDAAFNEHKVNRAQVGRETGISGQAVTQKLQRKSAVTPHEIEVYARHARMSVTEALGESALVLEVRDELDLIEQYRTLSPEQRRMLLEVARQFSGPATEVADDD